MAAPSWTPGMTLSSDDVNQWMVPKAGWKTALDTQYNVAPSLYSDPDLTVPVVQGSYVVEAMIRYYGNAGTDLNWQFSGPSLTGTFACLFYNSGNNYRMERHSATANMTSYTISTSSAAGMVIYGLFHFGGSGSLVFEWAENTSDASGVGLDVGTYLSAWRVS